MSIRLIRQESETPNVSNHDDARMVRYAYGGYDGFVKDRGQEIGHAISGTSFVVQSGVINLQGWEVEIDANGVSIPTSASVTNKQYYSVYLEVNCATDTAEIKSLTDPAGYPEIPESDDLTQNTIGTARLLLYHFTVTGGVIADIEKMVQGIEYAKKNIEDLNSNLIDGLNEIRNDLQDGILIPDNSKKVNSLEIKYDSSGILKIGETIIPQKRKIGEFTVGVYPVEIPFNLTGKIVEFEIKSEKRKASEFFKLKFLSGTPKVGRIYASEYVTISWVLEKRYEIDGNAGQVSIDDPPLSCVVYEIIE